MKPAGGRSSIRSFRTSSYVAPPTLYERRRALVSLFIGIVVVGMTISLIRLIVSIVIALWCKSGPLLRWGNDARRRPGVGCRNGVPQFGTSISPHDWRRGSRDL